MAYFRYQKLRAQSNHHVQLLGEVTNGQHYQGGIWGVFSGLFGLAGNELIVVSADATNAPAAASPLAVASEAWQPTARPVDMDPCSKEGLYVFRRFHVREGDVDEVVALSRQAWETFEIGQDYAAQPQGLFRPPSDDEGIVKLMLVTWYDGFASWETSRRPAPEAAENFRRRHALTLTTYAVATRLVGIATA